MRVWKKSAPADGQRGLPSPIVKALLVAAAGATAAVVGATVPGCGIVELKDPPADVNACRPSQMFFVDRVWPEFLAQSYGGKTCGDSNCHDAASGNLLLVIPPVSTPTPTFPLMSGSDWEQLYLSAAQEMTCTNVQGSELYTRPAGLRTHGGGKLLDDPASVEALLSMWVAASP